MIDLKVVEYIKAETSKGVSREKIESDLVQGGGWSKEDIQEHFLAIDNNTVESHILYQKQNSKTQYTGLSFFDVFATNLGIFIIYFSLANVNFLNSEILVIYGYIIHFFVLIMVAVIAKFRGKTDPIFYAGTGVLLLLIGFGSCFFAFAGSW